MAATPKPVSVQLEQEDTSLDGGAPTGNILFLAVPEPTYVAISDIASKRGMSVGQAFAQALSEFLAKESER